MYFYKNEYKINNHLSVMTISIDQIFNSKTGANTHIIKKYLILIFNQKYLIKDIGLK